MICCLRNWVLLFAPVMVMVSLSLSTVPCLQAVRINTETFLSPIFSMTPGSVVNRYFHDIDFPRGHIALKSFDAELVDEAGNPVPLSETYLHHWVFVRYFQHKEAVDSRDKIIARNNGVCQHNTLPQFFGLGSETRKTSTFIPDPYGIEFGNPTKIPPGYYEKMLLNVHAIDTREVENKLGCAECWCRLYNITVDPYGMPLKPDYKGGMRCCYDKTQCKVNQNNVAGERRGLYMRYTVKWVDWDDFILPVKVYILDVTDTWKPSTDSTGSTQEHHCVIEYDVESCSPRNKTGDGCNAQR